MSNERPRANEREVATARVYAQALLGLADREDLATEILEELESLGELLDRESGLERYLTSLLVDGGERSQALDRIFRERMSDLLLNTLQVMNRKGRAGLLRALVEAYRQEYDELKGIVDVKVKSAVPLSDRQRRRLEELVGRRTGQKPRLIERVDPEILAGLVVEVGDQKIDGSAVQQLRSMRKKLMERASREVQSGKAGLAFESGRS